MSADSSALDLDQEHPGIEQRSQERKNSSRKQPVKAATSPGEHGNTPYDEGDDSALREEKVKDLRSLAHIGISACGPELRPGGSNPDKEARRSQLPA
jgi:hypothetical protein